MIKASNFLLGTHDFTTFRSSICQSNSPIKTLDKIKIKHKIATFFLNNLENDLLR